MADRILYLTISFLVSLVFIILGIRQCRAKRPVTINSGEKPPREDALTSVAEWNHRHGRNFILLGCAVFLTLSAFSYFLERLDNAGLLAALLLAALFAEFAWVAHEHTVMKKTMIKK